MATTTSVLGLTKPAGNENALVSVLNNDMDLIDAEAGKERANIAANYSASSAYAVGDLCIKDGVLYRCNTAIGSGGEAWNASHWTQVTIAGQLAGLSDQIANIVERQNISVSGFNGNMRETELTIILKQGYKPYLLQVVTSQFDTSHYIHYANDINSSTGKFYIEHNLTSAVTTITAIILWIPNA